MSAKPDDVIEIRVVVRREVDIVLACQKGRALAEQLGMPGNDQVVVVIAISEVARNIVNYADCGEIVLSAFGQNGRWGISIVARDEGPGILDIERALQDGYSTGGGLGLGLAGAKRLMDEFKVLSQPGKGTTIVMKKWSRNG
ncbi:MAG: anti-sigma regulatory factor [Anaerolineae bacterium]|nr:anti-sigma regulatory factor [Anaerolineae bacterium]